MTARDEVLARIRAARDIGAPPGLPAAVSTAAGLPTAAEIPRLYRVTGDGEPGSPAVVERFVERVLDYRAKVHRSTPAEVAATLAAVLDGDVLGGDDSVVVPVGLAADWIAACRAPDRDVRVDGAPDVLTAAELDATDAVVTACRVAIAETGTIVLDADADQGRRALTLVPDHHIVVVFAEQIVASVPEALAWLEPAAPLTFISGPSATSDIEFRRVEGVHGPRRLDVIVVTS